MATVARVIDLPQYQTSPTVYSGPRRVMSHFYEHVMSESETIPGTEILSQQVPLSPMSVDDWRRHRSAVACQNCHEPLTHHNYKTRHHCHATGDYLLLACNNCNLQLKPKKLNVAGKVTNDYVLPIMFHNLKNEVCLSLTQVQSSVTVGWFSLGTSHVCF